MSAPDLRDLLRAVDPVPERPSFSPADERLLGQILTTPRRGPRRMWIGRVAVVAAAAAALLAVLVLPHGGSKPSDEIEAPAGTALSVPPGAVVHVITQHLSLMHGKVVPDGRTEGWAQPSTGRARFVGHSVKGGTFLQVTVDGNDRVRQWLRVASPQLTVRRSASLARSQRRLVTDRIAELAREDYAGLMPDRAVRHFHREFRARYAGNPAIVREDVVVRRLLAASAKGGTVEQGFFVRTYRDAKTGALVGYDRGTSRPDGSRPRIITAERVGVREVLTDPGAVRQLAWQPVGR